MQEKLLKGIKVLIRTKKKTSNNRFMNDKTSTRRRKTNVKKRGKKRFINIIRNYIHLEHIVYCPQVILLECKYMVWMILIFLKD